MSCAIDLKTIAFKIWLAVLFTALVQISFLSSSEAQPKAEATEATNANVAKGPMLEMDGFLTQVREGNSQFKGAQSASEGAALRSDEYSLLTRPTLVGDVNTYDSRVQTGNAIAGDRVKGHGYSLGVRQVTEFGLQGALTYKTDYTFMPAANSNFMESEFYRAGPVLELNQSLWRNGFGRETRAAKQLLSAQALATKYNNSFAQTEILSGAEATYWRLALAREAVDLSTENVQRAERLRGWSSRRQSSGLGDRSDSLQARTAYLARQLELKIAVDEEKAASRAFNTMRGLDSEVVTETLVAFNADVISQRIKLPERKDMRDDVKAAEQTMRAAEAQSKLSAEKHRPLVDVYASAGLNGRDRRMSEATSESFTNDHTNYAVGLKLEVPLDIGTARDTIKGHQAEARAARMIYDRKVFEQERLWKDLSISLRDSLERYKLAAEIEALQRDKMDYERVRHGRGRTTTFQVIQFETDYATAQWNRIKTQFDILNTYAKIRAFSGGSQ